jgi:hypothetical protein
MQRFKHPDGEKHHYIPVFYLKQWSDPYGRICEFTRWGNVVKPKMKHPDATGFMRGLNTFKELDPEAANFLESHFFRQADDRAYRALTLLLGDQTDLDADVKSSWCRFLMTLFHRTPEGIERMRQQVGKNLPIDLEPLRSKYHLLRRAGDPGTFDAFCSKFTNELTQHATLASLQTVMDSQRVGDVLFGMSWFVLLADHARYPLLTSDRPIIMSNGLGQPQSYLMLPISPRRVFAAVNRREVIDQIQHDLTPDKFVESINGRVVRQARKHAYGTNDAQLRFVSNRLGERMRWSPME